MRDFSTGFAAHVGSGATTLCWCWKLVRADGVTLGFTDHDVALSFDGVTYTPAHGLDGGETVARTGAQTQTAEVLGVLHADAITEADIAMGRYDGARVESWRVNWRDVGERHLMRADTIGEIVREDGVFRAELRSGQYALNVPKGRVYHHLCDARLGDGRCGLVLGPTGFKADAVVTAVEGGARITVSGLSGFADGWFAYGHVSWTSGARTGIEDGISVHSGAVITLDQTVADSIAVGDALTVYAGCDKQFSTCKSKFNNAVNFQGFPHIPGNDFLMRYPSEDDPMTGEGFVK
ncbi:DUF2163 domain-containing protein [Pelagibacterium halotolerans]|uniref:DUF2163 domain-containing protein n=1 Tax=Pelagibacterium halotolerans TaxID=531813 RepID=UPI00384E69CF